MNGEDLRDRLALALESALDGDADWPTLAEIAIETVREQGMTEACDECATRLDAVSDATRLLAGGWYLDASSDPAYADLFERGWLAFNSDVPEPGDYHLTPEGADVIDGALEKLT